MSEVIANRQRHQPMKQQRVAHRPLPDVTVDFVRQVSIDNTEQRQRQSAEIQQRAHQQHGALVDDSPKEAVKSGGMSAVAQRAQRLSRRHSSAAIVPVPGTEAAPTSLSSAGFGAGRSRSSSTRSPVGRRRIALHEQQSAFQQQQQPSVQWLNVPGSTGGTTAGSSRSTEQLERLELLLMAPSSWTWTAQQQQQHRQHRHLSGGKSPSGGGGRWTDNSAVSPGPSVSRDRLAVSPPPNSAASPSSPHQLRPHHQHSRSQSVRAPVAGDGGGRSRKSGSSRKKTSTTTTQNSSAGVQPPARPRGTSLPSNRAAAVPAAAAAGDNDGQVFADEEEGAEEPDYYLLRHFIVHGKGNKVVNRGDSFRRLRQQQGSQHSSTSSIRSLFSISSFLFLSSFDLSCYATERSREGGTMRE